MDKNIGSQSAVEVAKIMGVHKSRVKYLTNSVLRRLRWPNRLRAVTRFINEYSGKSS